MVDELRGLRAEQPVRIVAEDLEGSGRDVKTGAGEVEARHHVGRAVGQETVTRFAVLQVFLGEMPRRDIARRDDDAASQCVEVRQLEDGFDADVAAGSVAEAILAGQTGSLRRQGCELAVQALHVIGVDVAVHGEPHEVLRRPPEHLVRRGRNVEPGRVPSGSQDDQVAGVLRQQSIAHVRLLRFG